MLWGGSATAVSFLLLHLLVESAQSKTQNGKKSALSHVVVGTATPLVDCCFSCDKGF